MKELEPLIQQVTEIVQGSKEFVVSQAPDFIRQFIIYSYVETIGWLILSSIILGIVINRTLWLKREWHTVDDVVNGLGTLALGVGGFVSLLGSYQTWLIWSGFT